MCSRGEIVALLGSNGAGKTTTLRAVSNLLQAVRGRAKADAASFGGALHFRRKRRGSCCARAWRRFWKAVACSAP